MFLGFSGQNFPDRKNKKNFFFNKVIMCYSSADCRTSITTNHINDIHLVLMIFTFFSFSFFARLPVTFFLNPVRETYNQDGMAFRLSQVLAFTECPIDSQAEESMK